MSSNNSWFAVKHVSTCFYVYNILISVKIANRYNKKEVSIEKYLKFNSTRWSRKSHEFTKLVLSFNSKFMHSQWYWIPRTHKGTKYRNIFGREQLILVYPILNNIAFFFSKVKRSFSKTPFTLRTECSKNSP